MFVQEWVENKTRATSDVIGQVYGLLLLHSPLLVHCQIFTENGHYKLPNTCH